jgi:hypothetical protein
MVFLEDGCVEARKFQGKKGRKIRNKPIK